MRYKTARFFLAYGRESCMMVSVTIYIQIYIKRREPHPSQFGPLPIHQPDLQKDQPYQ